MMFSRLCAECDLRYPASQLKCLVCEGSTKLQGGMPPSDWKQQVEAVLNPPDPEPVLITEVPGVIMVFEEAGLLWVQQIDLTTRGVMLSHLSTFTLLEINGVVYELQGWHESKRRWWIQRAVPIEAPG